MRTLEKVYVLDYHEVEKMMVDECSVPEIGKDFSIVAMLELSNDMCLKIEKVGNDPTGYGTDFWNKYTKPRLEEYFSTGIWKTWMCGISDILEYFVGIGQLPAGNYIVEISW